MSTVAKRVELRANLPGGRSSSIAAYGVAGAQAAAARQQSVALGRCEPPTRPDPAPAAQQWRSPNGEGIGSKVASSPTAYDGSDALLIEALAAAIQLATRVLVRLGAVPAAWGTRSSA